MVALGEASAPLWDAAEGEKTNAAHRLAAAAADLNALKQPLKKSRGKKKMHMNFFLWCETQTAGFSVNECHFLMIRRGASTSIL